MRKTRILFIMLQLDAGGSERVVLDLARKLDLEQYEIYVVSFKGGVLEGALRKICTELFLIEKGKGFDLRAMLQISRIIRHYRIDVVNAHHYMPFFYSFLGARCLNNARLVYTEHSCPEVEGVADSIHGKIFNWMLYRVHAVVGVSKEIVSRFKSRYPRHKAKFKAVVNGVDIERFRNAAVRGEVRRRLGLDDSHLVIATVANFKTVKNHACILRAAARLKDELPRLRWLFVGTGFAADGSHNTEAAIKKAIGVLNLQKVVSLVGYQEDVPAFLNACDVFCLASFSEGLPVSILEAMASGLAVVGSNVRGINEVVEHRKTGMLFDSDADGQLADVVRELAVDPQLRAAIAENGFRYVVENHNTEKWVKLSCSIFSSFPSTLLRPEPLKV